MTPMQQQMAFQTRMAIRGLRYRIGSPLERARMRWEFPSMRLAGPKGRLP